MNLKDISGKIYGNESRVELIPNPPPQKKKDIEDIPKDDSDETVLLRRLITIWNIQFY